MYHGDLGSRTKYTCIDVALSVVTLDHVMECVENQFYDVNDVRGVWRDASIGLSAATAVNLPSNRANVGCTVEECFEVQGDYHGFVTSNTWPYRLFNRPYPALNSYYWAQSLLSDIPDENTGAYLGIDRCMANGASYPATPCGLDIAASNFFAKARYLQNPLDIIYTKA
jgi:hypothetical protein